MANEIIRMSDTTDFESQDWLVTKHNACGPRPDSDAQRIVTAEWANHVDESLKQCNKAFNGLPVGANNVCGSIHTVARATVQDLSAVIVPLIDGVPDPAWVYLELTAFLREAPSGAGSLSICKTDAVFDHENGTLTRRDAFSPTWIYPVNGVHTCNLMADSTLSQIQVQLQVLSGEFAPPAYWTLDYRFIVLPQTELTLPDALPGPAPCVLGG